MGQFRPSNPKPATESAANVEKLLLATAGAPRWINNRLGDKRECATKLRILPAFDLDGTEAVALNPEAGLGEELEAGKLFGPVLFSGHGVQDLTRKRMTFLTRHPIDGVVSNSGAVIDDNWSPFGRLRNRLYWKLRESQLLAQAKQPLKIPRLWLDWLAQNRDIDQFLPNEEVMLLWQVLAYEVNGVAAAEPTYGVTSFKKSALKGFLCSAGKRVLSNQDLSLTNNEAGDFCSAEGGRMLIVRKVQTGEGKDRKIDYTLNFSPNPMRLTDAQTNLWKPWDTLLRYPYVEDVISWLLAELGPEAIDYGLRETAYDAYIPSDVRGASDNIDEARNTKEIRAEFNLPDAKSRDSAPSAAPAERAAAPRAAAPAPAPAPTKARTKYWICGADRQVVSVEAADIWELLKTGAEFAVCLQDGRDEWRAPSAYGFVPEPEAPAQEAPPPAPAPAQAPSPAPAARRSPAPPAGMALSPGGDAVSTTPPPPVRRGRAPATEAAPAPAPAPVTPGTIVQPGTPQYADILKKIKDQTGQAAV